MRVRRPESGEDAATVARVRGYLQAYLNEGAESVSVKHVLDLLNPRGLWLLDRAPESAEKGQPQVRVAEPATDPLTGCLPVTPTGGAA